VKADEKDFCFHEANGWQAKDNLRREMRLAIKEERRHIA
jgi:hypothetical protein